MSNEIERKKSKNILLECDSYDERGRERKIEGNHQEKKRERESKEKVTLGKALVN